MDNFMPWPKAVALVVALIMIAGCGTAGCGPRRITVDIPVSGVPPTDPLVQRIQAEQVGIFQSGLNNYANVLKVRDYTCTLYKLERMSPKGAFENEQKLACKFREQPFSIFTETLVNPRGAVMALYVEGRWGDKMLALPPKGIARLIAGTVATEPRSDLAKQNTLRFLDQFGFKRSLETMFTNYTVAAREGILHMEIKGEAKVGSRDTIVLEVRVREKKPTGRFEYPHVKVFLDRQWLLPMAVHTWDVNDIQRGEYRYDDVKFNVGLTDKAFDPAEYGMKPPADSTPATGPAERK